MRVRMIEWDVTGRVTEYGGERGVRVAESM